MKAWRRRARYANGDPRARASAARAELIGLPARSGDRTRAGRPGRAAGGRSWRDSGSGATGLRGHLRGPGMARCPARRQPPTTRAGSCAAWSASSGTVSAPAGGCEGSSRSGRCVSRDRFGTIGSVRAARQPDRRPRGTQMSEAYDLYQLGKARLREGMAAQATVPLEKAKRLEPEKASIREALGHRVLPDHSLVGRGSRVPQADRALAGRRLRPLRARTRAHEAGPAVRGGPLSEARAVSASTAARRAVHRRPASRRDRRAGSCIAGSGALRARLKVAV